MLRREAEHCLPLRKPKHIMASPRGACTVCMDPLPPRAPDTAICQHCAAATCKPCSMKLLQHAEHSGIEPRYKSKQFRLQCLLLAACSEVEVANTQYIHTLHYTTSLTNNLLM